MPKTRDGLLELLALVPTDAAAHCNLGIVYHHMGQEDKAKAEFQKALAIDPDNTGAIRMIAGIDHRAAWPDMKRYLDLLDKLPPDDPRSADLHFALGTIFEGGGDHERSFFHYKAANGIIASFRKLDLAGEEEIFSQIQTAFDGTSAAPSRTAAPIPVTPIFIVGMPRSGTSLVEQILASHPSVAGAGELTHLESVIAAKAGPVADMTADKINALTIIDYREMARQYISRLETHGDGRPFVTDKMPHNFRLIGFIKKMFPAAPIIHCRRDPVDCCFSIYKHYFPAANMNFAYDLSHLGVYYNLYADLMRHWHTIFPGGIFDVRYEELVGNQREVTQSLLSFCNLPWDDRCLDYHSTDRPVVTASALQVKKPIYNSAVGSARNFQPYLANLLNVLRVDE